MQLKQNSPFVKMFVFCDGLWSEFMARERSRQDRVDFCQFVRTIILWAPFVLVSQAVFLVGVVYVVIYNPLQLFGLGYLWLLSEGLGVAGLVFLATFFYWRWVDSSHKRKKATASDVQQPRRRDWLHELFEIIALWYRSVKGKFCPIIEIKGDDQ